MLKTISRMKHNIFSFILVVLLPATVQAGEIPDSLKARFERQLFIFPQEKIYVHNDRPVYMAGETIWFSAYVVDALTNIMESPSRYIYGELTNQIDSVICRVRISPFYGKFHGFFDIPVDLPEGEYVMRFYTRYMINVGEPYFFKKRIRIGTPLSARHYTEASFVTDENRTTAELRFIDISSGKAIKPDNLLVTEPGQGPRRVNVNDTLVRFRINTKEKVKSGAMLVEYEHERRKRRQYINLPAPADTFDIVFLPEGGNLIAGAFNSIAFKAINAQGMGQPVTGAVYNQSGDTICTFASNHLGMGVLFMRPAAGDKYYALCKGNGNTMKKVVLPQAENDKISVHSTWRNDILFITLLTPAGTTLPDSLFLVMQKDGGAVFIAPWEKHKEYMMLKSSSLPSGIIQVLLVDSALNPLSERLVFNINEAGTANISLSTDKQSYGKRELINASINVSDEQGNPLIAYMSVAVTDNRDVAPDTTMNILSTLLLTSELKGFIETPAWYFPLNDKVRTKDLDMLMMTQGWSRYNVPSVLKGTLDIPTHKNETSQQITGMVKGGFFMNRTAEGYQVSLLSTERGFFYAETETDENGFFAFNDFEAPDSTRFIIQGKNPKGNVHVELVIDPETYPPVLLSLPLDNVGDNRMLEQYISKADKRYAIDNMMSITLQEIEVTAAKKAPPRVSEVYSSAFSTVITNEKIERMNPSNIFMILQTIAGVMVTGTDVSIRGAQGPPLLLVDDVEMDFQFLGDIVVYDVEAIEVMKGAEAAIFGSRGGNGVIMIKTKTGEGFTARSRDKPNIKWTTPLGYQIPREFYSPKYETTEEKADAKPDLRTTVFWSPDVRTSPEGTADISFYSNDLPANYSIVIEGITHEGKIIHTVARIGAAD